MLPTSWIKKPLRLNEEKIAIFDAVLKPNKKIKMLLETISNLGDFWNWGPLPFPVKKVSTY